MKTLTWYPGTILPYESLWHVLLRATWLNDLRAGDIQKLYTRQKSPYMPDGCTVKNSRLVGRALGEPARVFSNFSVWEQFSYGVRCTLMCDRLRWCPACIEGGFHTLLGSILLVSRCPIHDSLLVSSCPVCNGRFSDNVRGLFVGNQSCRCGRTSFYSGDSVWNPVVSPVEANAWAPVAKWVKQVGDIAISESFERAPLGRTKFALFLRWCHDSGITSPACFDKESTFWPDPAERKQWSIYRASSGDLKDIKTPEPPSEHFLPASNRPSEQSTIYRAIGRYIRRHGCANPDGKIKILMSTLDPAAFAISMAHDPKARVAFTEMLWARQMEPWAVYRRWPNRPSEPGFSKPVSCAFKTHIGVHPKVGRTINCGVRSMTRQGSRWVEQHATAIEARQVWGRATRQTTKSIEDSWADWLTDHGYFESTSDADAAVWFCRPKGTCVDFVGYVRNAHMTPFLDVIPVNQKKVKSQAAICPTRREYVEGLSKNPCLTWSQRDSWQVQNGATPNDDDVRRVALLHTGQPTDCWIFRSRDVFIARVINGLIQASGATAKEALCSLRIAIKHYRKTYEPHHAVKTTTELIVEPIPAGLVWAAYCIRMRASHMRGSDVARFWSAAWISRSLGEGVEAPP